MKRVDFDRVVQLETRVVMGLDKSTQTLTEDESLVWDMLVEADKRMGNKPRDFPS